MSCLVVDKRLEVGTIMRLKDYVVQDLNNKKCGPAPCSAMHPPGLPTKWNHPRMLLCRTRAWHATGGVASPDWSDDGPVRTAEQVQGLLSLVSEGRKILCRVIIIMDADCLGPPTPKLGEPIEWGKGPPGPSAPGPANGHAGPGPAYGGARPDCLVLAKSPGVLPCVLHVLWRLAAQIIRSGPRLHCQVSARHVLGKRCAPCRVPPYCSAPATSAPKLAPCAGWEVPACCVRLTGCSCQVT